MAQVLNDWLKKYPIKYMMSQHIYDPSTKKQTYTLMEKYGIMNVRGEKYDKFHLTIKEVTDILSNTTSFMTNNCIMCGDSTHNQSMCEYNKKIKEAEEKQKQQEEEGNKKCDCITSRLSSHRKKNCMLHKGIDTIYNFTSENIF